MKKIQILVINLEANSLSLQLRNAHYPQILENLMIQGLETSIRQKRWSSEMLNHQHKLGLTVLNTNISLVIALLKEREMDQHCNLTLEVNKSGKDS